MSVSACAGRYRTELVGQGTAFVQPRIADDGPTTSPAHPPWAVSQGLQLAQGSYELALWFDVPRAQVVDWTVTCPGVELTGTAGESFAQYRARRLGELRAERDRDRERVASLTSTLVAGVATPVGGVAVRGDAISDAVIGDVIDLPQGDVGAGRLASTVRVLTGSAGVCAVTATADDATVLGTYQVTRIRDLHLEARAREAAQRDAAIQVRGRMQARLVSHGADPERTARIQAAERARAEARLQLEIEARARAQVEAEARLRAQAQLELEHREIAFEARRALRGRCVGNGADPEKRARMHAAAEASITTQRAHQQAELDAQVRVTVDLQQRRLDLAQRARDDLRRRWVAWGAIPRPPMPALLAEEAGEPPFPGARWTPGMWEWVNGRWTWRAGYWSDPDVFGDAGGDLMVGVETGLDFDLGGTSTGRPQIVDHRSGPKVRDHRNGQDDGSATIRDHRDRESPSTSPSTSKPEPTVRDHRNNAREEMPKSTIRDHRDDNKDEDKDEDKDDRSGTVRDHRRR